MAQSEMWFLVAADGRFATNDTRSGPSLTKVRALAYAFASFEQAEQQLPLYERALGVSLDVEGPEAKFQFFRDGVAGEVVDLETLMVGNEDNALSDWCVEADVGEERELAAPYADVVLKRVA